MSANIDLDPVGRITAAAIGDPGERVFYLQARKEDVLVSLVLEKQQVALLTMHIDELLERLGTPEESSVEVEALDLEEPIVPEFRVGRIGLGYDDERQLVILQCEEFVPEPEEEEGAEPPEAAADPGRVRLWATQGADVCGGASGRARGGCRPSVVSDVRRGDGSRRSLLSAFQRSPRSQPAHVIDLERLLGLLSSGEMEIHGLLPYASNATLLTTVRSGSEEVLAVYKPRRGERPLWDFPSGTLCLREAAAWVLDLALGWNLVPPTVLREGPAGFGAVQFFVEEDIEVDVRRLIQTHPDEMRRIALFDVIANNADRKAGHLVVDTAGKLWSVDHGICFSDDPKLRTVIWAFEGEPAPKQLVETLERLESDHGWVEDLVPLLHADEIDALRCRIADVIRDPCYPAPLPGGRHVPWPPW